MPILFFADKKVDLKKRFRTIFLHCLVITVMFFVCVSPRLYQGYKTVGVPVLDMRQADYVCKVLPFTNAGYKDKLYIMAERKTFIPDTKSKRGWAKIWQGVECFVSGAYEPYLILALLGIFLWWKKKENRVEAFILFSVIALNAAVLITISNSKRYYSINAIMLLPFTFIAIKFIWELLTSWKKFFKPILIIGLAALAVFQVINGAKKAIKRKYDYEYKTGFWIEANKDKYCSKKDRILVAATQAQFALWADALWLNISENKIQFEEQLGEMQEADFVVLESDQRDLIEIFKNQKGFKLLEQQYPQVLVFVNLRRGQK